MLTVAHEGPRLALVVAARRRAARALDFPARYVGAHGSGCAANWEPPPPVTAKAVASDPMRPPLAAADRRVGLCGGSTRPCHAHVKPPTCTTSPNSSSVHHFFGLDDRWAAIVRGGWSP